MDGDELDLFERSLRHATGRCTGAELDAALDDLGWGEALADDRRASISLLFALQGAAGATSGALERVLRSRLGATAAAGAAVLLPAVDRWDPPGVLDDGRLRVRGVGTASLLDAPTSAVVARTGGDPVMATVPTSSLTLRPVRGLDPWLGLVEVTAEPIELDEAPAHLDEDGWSRAVTDARLALAHELVGVSRTMLAMAREHALGRVQFGRPVAGFQAVRHRLAETLVAIETAEAILDAAWLDGTGTTAAMAKAVAGREARTAARHCQQVLAGIGFTTEHDLHRYVRRGLVLDSLFGSAESLTTTLGQDLLATRRLPPLPPL